MAISNQLKFLSHHAYCLIGSDSIHAELIKTLKNSHSITGKGNQDFYDNAYEVFTIDDARKIKSLAETKPVTDSRDNKVNGGAGKKIFILQMNGITIEAQNALLKLLEEPPEYAHFFLIIPSAHLLLPTVKSRISFLTTEKSKDNVSDELQDGCESFLKMSAPKRLDFLKSLLAEIDKEKKTKQDAIDFLNALEVSVYEKLGVKKGSRELGVIEHARKYVNDRAPSMKMLLEYVALNV